MLNNINTEFKSVVSNGKWTHLILIMLAISIPHLIFLYLLNGHEFWDSVFLENSDESNLWRERFELKYLDSNWFIPFFLTEFLLSIEQYLDTNYRTVYMSMYFLLISCALYAGVRICRNFQFTINNSLLICGLGITFPSLHVFASSVHIIFLFSITSFIGAVAIRICLKKPRPHHAVIIWLLVILALQLQSLALLSCALFIYLLWKSKTSLGNLLSLEFFGTSAFLVIPFVWRAIYAFNPPEGLYAGYNSIHLGTFISLPINSIYTIYHYFGPFFFIGVAFICGIFCIQRYKKKRIFLWQLVLCGFIFIITIGPYFLVGKNPSGPWNDWGSRHGLLFVFSIPIIWGILFWSFKNVKAFLVIATMALVFQSTILTVLFSNWYYRSLEDKQLIHLITDLPIVRTLNRDLGPAIVLDADTHTFNRRYRDYELSEYMKASTGSSIYVGTSAEFLIRAKKQQRIYPITGNLVYTSIGGFNVTNMLRSNNCITISIGVDEAFDQSTIFSNIQFLINKIINPDWRTLYIENVEQECVDEQAINRTGAW